jgi:phosphoribosylamine--glycine ligase
MHVLVVGSGNREMALITAMGASPLVKNISSVKWTIPEEVVDYAKRARLTKDDFVIIGPEAPLAAGLVDELAKANIPAFGPTKKAAMLEASKIGAMMVCESLGIPTPRYTFTPSFADARRAIEENDYLVVKADGLAAGKGVKVAETKEEAIEAAHNILCKEEFGDAGRQILLQERLYGPEVSMFFLCDGQEATYIGSARDYKHRYDGNVGPMTGGMGAYSPAPLVTPRILRQVRHWVSLLVRRMWVNDPTNPYRGVLFVGIILVEEKGELVPKVLEFNVRFGDPEAQVLLPLINEDIIPYFLATLEPRGLTRHRPPTFKEEAAVCVCTAEEGYPKMGSRKESFAGLGATIPQARTNAYQALGTAERAGKLKGRVWRTDIAL